MRNCKIFRTLGFDLVSRKFIPLSEDKHDTRVERRRKRWEPRLLSPSMPFLSFVSRSQETAIIKTVDRYIRRTRFGVTNRKWNESRGGVSNRRYRRALLRGEDEGNPSDYGKHE